MGKKSLSLFRDTPYLDNIQNIYTFEISISKRLDDSIRRDIKLAHNSRDTNRLLILLESQIKFPYEDPIWYILKNVSGCFDNNPRQIARIADILYGMTAEETIFRLEAPPKINTQIGPLFRNWLQSNFESLDLECFERSIKGTYILEASEEEGKKFVLSILDQDLEKRPDLVAKVNEQYIIGEAKWIGQPGGNQGKQVSEVMQFCENQRGHVKRIGIIDGFPWALYNKQGHLINNKEAVLVQESPFDIFSALLLRDYLNDCL